MGSFAESKNPKPSVFSAIPVYWRLSPTAELHERICPFEYLVDPALVICSRFEDPSVPMIYKGLTGVLPNMPTCWDDYLLSRVE